MLRAGDVARGDANARSLAAVGECQQGIGGHQLAITFHPAIAVDVDPRSVVLLHVHQMAGQFLSPIVRLARVVVQDVNVGGVE